MPLRPNIPLLPGWVDETTQGSATNAYFRNPTRSGPLQVSWAEFAGGRAPQVSEARLLEIALKTGGQFGCGPPFERASGPCALGTYATAKFSLPPDRCFGQVWVLSNGADFVIATYMSAREPDPIEVTEAQQIVSRITLGAPS
jgi:hypothetical protein